MKRGHWMRLLICAGGTGGGVYPALAVLKAFTDDDVLGNQIVEDDTSADWKRAGTSNLQLSSVLWVGSEGGMEAELVLREGIPFRAIPAAGVHGVGLRALPRNLLHVARGVWAALNILREFRPQVI